MAAHWDNRNSRPIPSNHKGYRSQRTAFQHPFPEHLDNTRPSVLPVPEHHGPATSFRSPFAVNIALPTPYYEGYTIRPDDLASSEDRWSIPPRKSIPATQEDLHTEVIRQRQSGRTACRELEDCHGPKRQYIDRLIKERSASTSLGHFEVAQLRLERIPKDSGKASNRSSGRSSHTRDNKQKDLAKPRQKTVYMHIILQFIRDSSRGITGIPQGALAPRNLNVANSHPSARPYSTDEDTITTPMSSDDQSPVFPEASHRPTLSRGRTYAAGNEQFRSLPSSHYITRGTQTTLPVNSRPRMDWCSEKFEDDATQGDASAEDTRTTTNNVNEGMPQKSPSSDDEAISVCDSVASHGSAIESTEEESRSVGEYEKPPWFQNLQPGMLLHQTLKRNFVLIRADGYKVKSPGMTDEQSDISEERDNGEPSTTHEKKDTDNKHDKEMLQAQGQEDNDCAQPDILSWSGESLGQKTLDIAAGHTKDEYNDQSPVYTENESAPMATDVANIDTTDEHASSGPTKIPVSEYFSNVPEPPQPEKLPPSERYKPRPLLNLIPARPSLTRAPASYDGRPTDDPERKTSKRVSFQQSAASLYTPPSSTTTSSPVSPSASPQLPLRSVFAKPAPVSIPPGQYTPMASSSPASPSSPPAACRPYACLAPECDSSFDHPYDRDRHERQHQIGDPPYSQCPICHHSRPSAALVDVGLREMLIAHINRRH